MKSTLNSAQFLSHEYGDDTYTVYGVNLGADFTAEHEFGIDGLRDLFGIDTSKIGLEGRKATVGLTEPHVFYGETKTHGVILVSAGGFDIETLSLSTFLSKQLDRYQLYVKSFDPACAWDSYSFGIASCDKDFLEQLYGAIKRADVALYFHKQHPSNPFGRFGLCVSIASLVPEETQKLLKEADEDAIALREAALATGIYTQLRMINRDKLFSAPKGYYALQPRWAKNFENFDRPTRYKVIFWLNPMNQTKYKSGWYTVEELEEWLQDRGPVVKKHEEIRYA